jgi:tetratricopeptide (TPR) repeat protein
MKRYLLLILLFNGMNIGKIQAQQVNEKIGEGNDLYKQKQYDKAITAYNEALKMDPANTTAKFNIANTLVRQEKNSEAIKLFEEIAKNANETDLKGKAYYNKGVVLSGQQKLEESIEAYKNALLQNPNDTQARENLQKALLELKQKKTPPPPKEDNKKKQQQQQPKMDQKEAEQRLKLLEQKEKEVQERQQKEKSKSGSNQQKDW